MGTTYGPQFDTLIRRLRKAFPLPETVSVITAEGLKDDAHTVYFEHPKPTFVIYIRRGMSWGLAIDALIHEWGHVLDTSQTGIKETWADDHSDTWGACYAQCYRVVHE